MLIVDSQIPIGEDTLPPMIHRQVETDSKDDLIAEMATAGVEPGIAAFAGRLVGATQ